MKKFVLLNYEVGMYEYSNQESVRLLFRNCRLQEGTSEPAVLELEET